VFARQHFVGSLYGGSANALIDHAEIDVHQRGRFLYRRQCTDKREGHPLARDLEVLQTALRLSAP
jgi:hypothetical protein